MQLSFIGWQVCYPGIRSRDIIDNRQCGSLDKKVCMTGQPLIRRPQKYFRPLNKGFIRHLTRTWYKAEVKSQRLWKISYSARIQTYDTTQIRSLIRNKWRPNFLIPLVMFWLIWWTKRTLLKNSPYYSFYQRRWSLLFSMLYSFCKIIWHCKQTR